MLAEFVAVVPQTPLTGADHLPPRVPGRAGRIPGAQTIALAPADIDSQTAALTAELLGTDPRCRAGRPDRRTGRREPVLRRGDRARSRRTRRARRAPAAPTSAAATPPTSVCPPRCRPPSPPASTASAAAGQTHAECRGGHRFAVRAPSCWPRCVERHRTWHRVDARPTDRSGGVHAARRVRVSAPVDPRGGLRVAAEVGSRRTASAAGRGHRAARPRFGRRKRRADRRTPGGGRRSACSLRLAHARRRWLAHRDIRRGQHELAARTRCRRPATRRRRRPHLDADRAAHPAVRHRVANRWQCRRHRLRRTA